MALQPFRSDTRSAASEIRLVRVWRHLTTRVGTHMDEVTENGIPVAAEDKFLVFAFGSARSLCPRIYDADRLGEMILKLADTLGEIVPIFDLRGAEGYYNDVDQFITSVGGNNAHVLLGKREIALGWESGLAQQGLLPIRANGAAIRHTTVLTIPLFDCEAESYVNEVMDDVTPGLSYNDIVTKLYQAQQADFQAFWQSVHVNSVMIEFVMSTEAGRVTVTPYHGNAIHEVETKPSSVMIARPAVIAKLTGAIFSDEIIELQRLINDQSTKERQLQRFLEDHPNFLTGLNYQNIYPQLVLERDGDCALKPDFILEPFDDAFCDILDIKLPSQCLVVGRKDRLDLAAGLHQVAAQLREYAAYFEQDKYRRMVQEKYGLRIYRPRLIAVIGRDMKQMAEPQVRRAMTQYDNLAFLTFDELVRHAKRRLLL